MIKNFAISFPKIKLSSIRIDNTIEPEITLEFKLYNSKNKNLSYIYLSNKYYYENNLKFSLSPEVNEKIKNIIYIFKKNFIDNGYLKSICG